jgi:hypothetical protein
MLPCPIPSCLIISGSPIPIEPIRPAADINRRPPRYRNFLSTDRLSPPLPPSHPHAHAPPATPDHRNTGNPERSLSIKVHVTPGESRTHARARSRLAEVVRARARALGARNNLLRYDYNLRNGLYRLMRTLSASRALPPARDAIDLAANTER